MTDISSTDTHDRPSAPPARFANLKILSPDTRDAIDAIAERVDVPTGAVIVAEGERSNDLYIVERGSVVGVRSGGEGDEQWPVLHLGEGDIVGDQSFLDGGPQQLTARAVTDCVMLRIDPVELLTLERGDHYYDNLRASVGIAVVQRLRVGTDVYVSTLRHQLDITRTQQQFGKFFLFALGLCAVAMLASNVVMAHIENIDVHTQSFAWAYLLVLLVPSLSAVWAMKVPVAEIGLSRRNLRRSVTEGLVVSGVLVVLTTLLVIVSNRVDALPDLHFTFDPLGAVAYFFHSFFQELVTRGFMQTSFQRFLNDRKGYVSVIVTGVFFGVFHVHFGLGAVAVIVISSLVFGTFYLRTKNLAGVTLVHFAIGACAFSTGIL